MLWGTYRPGLYLGVLSHGSCLSPSTRTAYRRHRLPYHVHLVDSWHALLDLNMQRLNIAAQQRSVKAQASGCGTL